MVNMKDRRSAALSIFLLFALSALRNTSAQVIEFESGGLKYLTQTKNGVTVMFAPLHTPIREYAVIQVAISNGSPVTWNFKPDDFRYLPTDAAPSPGLPAGGVVNEFLRHGRSDDVIKLVTAYENGLYGMVRPKSTNGYESRRQAVMASATSAKFKAAAAASAIVFAPTRLKPGESTDGAVFFAHGGKPLGPGKLVVQAAGATFEFANPYDPPKTFSTR